MPEDENKFSRVSGEHHNIDRVHELQREINEVKIIPWNPNELKGEYNYKLWIELIGCLLDEVWSRLNEDEKNKGVVMREIVFIVLKKYPPMKMKSNSIQKGIVHIISNREKVKKVIIEYDNLIRDFIEKYYAPSPAEQGGDESGVLYE